MNFFCPQQISSCKHSKAFGEFLLSLGWPVNVASHPGWAGNIQEAWARGRGDSTVRSTDSSYLQSSKSASTRTGSDEREVSGSDSDRYASCRESFDSETSSSGKSSPAGHSSPSRPAQPDAKLVDEILYYADVSCEVAFIMPSLLPRYQRFRRMASQVDSFDEEIGPVRRRRTRSGSTGSLEASKSGSQSDLKSKLSRQASEGVTVHEVNGTLLTELTEIPPRI